MTNGARTDPAVEERPAPPEGLLETTVGVLTEPVATLRRLTSHPRVPWALTVAVLVSLASSLAGATRVGGAQLSPVRFKSFAPPQELRGALVALSIVLSPVLALLFLLAWSGIAQAASRMLGGRGTYAGTLTGFGFATVPSVLGVPAQLLPLALAGAGSVLAGVIQFGLAVWVLTLEVLTLRENHAFSTARAIAAVLIPIAVLIGVLIVVGVALALLLAAAVGNR